MKTPVSPRLRVVLSKTTLDQQTVIRIDFPYDKSFMEMLKSRTSARWSGSLRSWYIPEEGFDLRAFYGSFSGVAFIDYTALKKKPPELKPVEPSRQAIPYRRHILPGDRRELVERFRLWMHHKRYGESTVKTYCEAISGFLAFTADIPVSGIRNEDMVRYVNECLIARGLSHSCQNQVINAAKLFFREIIRTKIDYGKLERPRREHKLPNVLSKEEVKKILDAPVNQKHRVMLSVIYACGLRRSELLNLKPVHVDSKRQLLLIINSKGKKDRVVPLSERITVMLREYYKMYRPKEWLFEGQVAGTRYSEQSLQSVLKQAVAKAGIRKPVTLHWLRHSYATHLLESGTDLRYIQEILGHKNSKTTEIYTHVSTKSLQKIKSPFDDL
jgi:integrase/recombinase XerD